VGSDLGSALAIHRAKEQWPVAHRHLSRMQKAHLEKIGSCEAETVPSSCPHNSAIDANHRGLSATMKRQTNGIFDLLP